MRVAGGHVTVSGNTSGNSGRQVVTFREPTVLTVTEGDLVCFLDGGGDITLPSATGNTVRLTAKNISGASRRVAAAAGQSLDRRSTLTLGPGESAEVVSDGAQWWTL